MKLWDNIKAMEHTFAGWVVKQYTAFRNEEPSLVAAGDRIYPYVKSAVTIALSFESPAVALLAAPVLDRIHAGLDTAAGLIYDFGATPTAATILTSVQSDISSLESVAGIKSEAAKGAIAKALGSLQSLSGAVSGAIAAVAPPAA